MATVLETKPHSTCSPQTRRRISHPQEKCEIWVREVSLVIPKATTRAEEHMPDHANPISIENKAMLPQFTSKTRACIYSQDGRCVGMLSPELFQNLNSFSLCKGLRATHPNLPPTEGCSLQTGGPACAQTKMHITIKQNPQSES